jgi:lysophospholipase L1-like esterase
MSRFVDPTDPHLAWHGAVSLQLGDAGVTPWRLPFGRLALFPFEDLRLHAAMPAGVRIALRSDTRSLACRFQAVGDSSPARLDLFLGGQPSATAALAGRERVEFSGLPAGEKLLELWLPHDQPFSFQGLELDERATLAAPDDARPRWITYGSSISQCREAESPSRTWPALVARRAALNLTCLGFSGQCHIEPMLARLIRDQPADLISLCLGINVYGAASLNLRTFRPAVLGFVSIVRERHPETPLAVISPIFCPDRESQPNEVGMTLRIMREEIRAAVETLTELGDANLHYVDGLTLLGEGEAHLLPDRLHPNQEGYELMAWRFATDVLPHLRPQPAKG